MRLLLRLLLLLLHDDDVWQCRWMWLRMRRIVQIRWTRTRRGRAAPHLCRPTEWRSGAGAGRRRRPDQADGAADYGSLLQCDAIAASQLIVVECECCVSALQLSSVDEHSHDRASGTGRGERSGDEAAH